MVIILNEADQRRTKPEHNPSFGELTMYDFSNVLSQHSWLKAELIVLVSKSGLKARVLKARHDNPRQIELHLSYGLANDKNIHEAIGSYNGIRKYM